MSSDKTYEELFAAYNSLEDQSPKETTYVKPDHHNEETAMVAMLGSCKCRRVRVYFDKNICPRCQKYVRTSRREKALSKIVNKAIR